jgi:CBS-domain-containing membrane protein
MAVDAVSVGPDTSLREVARVMVELKISGLPVVDDENKVIGIVTEGDFVRKELERGRLGGIGMLGAIIHDDSVADAETVGEIMTTDVRTISPDASLVEAARQMTEHGVKRMPVVDHEDHLIGVISRHDIVQAYTRPDEVIEDEIREDIIVRLLYLDPATLEVAVERGVVTVAGEVPTRSDARLLEAMVQRSDGVIRAVFDLEWKVDDTRQPTPEAPLP